MIPPVPGTPVGSPELVEVLGAWHQALAHRPVSGTQFSNGSAADDSACQTPIRGVSRHLRDKLRTVAEQVPMTPRPDQWLIGG